MSISTPAGGGSRSSAASTDKKSPADVTPAGGTKPEAGAEDTSAAKSTSTTKRAAAEKGGTTEKPAAAEKNGAAGKKAASGGKSGTKAAKGAGPKSGGAKGGPKGGPRKVKPVKVTQERAWGPIALFVAVGALALGIIGYGGWAAYKGSQPFAERADDIAGILNYRKSDPDMLKQGDHRQGSITYEVLPPVGGPHNGTWQNCMGDVYDAPIANEHAVHSMEHGAVWITYRSDLPKDQVEQLADKVRGNEFMLMSPVDNLDAPISLQAWGFKLKVDDADDSRIDEFIKTMRVNAGVEEGASCAGGITATGTTPRELGGM